MDYFNLFTVLKKLKECVGFFFFNNLIATNGRGFTQLCVSPVRWENCVKPMLYAVRLIMQKLKYEAR